MGVLYTLLLAHPRQYFGLEEHGETSLEDLNLAPSASLTLVKL